MPSSGASGYMFRSCPACTGLGSQLKVDPALIIPDEDKAILDGAIQASGWNSIRGDGISRMYFDALAKKYRFKLTTPWKDLKKEVREVILYGTGGEELELHYDQPRGKGVLRQSFEGICNSIERRYRETQSDAARRELEECMSERPCPACQGRRLKMESLAVTVGVPPSLSSLIHSQSAHTHTHCGTRTSRFPVIPDKI